MAFPFFKRLACFLVFCCTSLLYGIPQSSSSENPYPCAEIAWVRTEFVNNCQDYGVLVDFYGFNFSYRENAITGPTIWTSEFVAPKNPQALQVMLINPTSAVFRVRFCPCFEDKKGKNCSCYAGTYCYLYGRLGESNYYEIPNVGSVTIETAFNGDQVKQIRLTMNPIANNTPVSANSFSSLSFCP